MKKIANAIVKVANAIAPGVDWKNVSISTYVRYILAFLTTINNVVIALGLNPIKFSEDKIYVVASVLINVVVLFVNTYKDNPTSKEGVVGAIVRNTLKEMNRDDNIDNEKVIQNIKTILDNPDADVVVKNDSEKLPDDEIYEETSVEDDAPDEESQITETTEEKLDDNE